MNGGTWEPRGSLPILETRLRPRDLRGRVIVSEANGIRVFLPGVSCTAPGYWSTSLDCVREPDVSWPVGERNEFSLAPGRNYLGSPQAQIRMASLVFDCLSGERGGLAFGSHRTRWEGAAI